MGTGTNAAACCDQKTCSDFSCSAVTKQAKASPTQPTAGDEPTAADCCEDIAGKCSGNTGGTGDVTCTTGYKDKSNKASITGTDVAACCDQKTCSDFSCSALTQKPKV